MVNTLISINHAIEIADKKKIWSILLAEDFVTDNIKNDRTK